VGGRLSPRAAATDLVRFAGGPKGHQLWAEAKVCFVCIDPHANQAEAYAWLAEHRLWHTTG